MSDLREAMDQAALAWVESQVITLIGYVEAPLSTELRAWLAQMPGVDRHKGGPIKADDGQYWYAGCVEPPVGQKIEIKQSDGALWQGFWASHWHVDPKAKWRYI